MLKPKVSFIIVNWNGKEFLKECIDSILSQTYKNYEIIIVDNGSSDGSIEFLERNYDIEKLIKLEKNYGFAEANNIAISYATGDYIALINNDLVLESNWLKENLDVFIRNHKQNIGMVATKILQYHNRDYIDSAGVEYLPFGAIKDYKGLNKDDEIVNIEKEVFGACAAAALYKKDMINEIGFFDKEFFAYFEDSDLNFRAQLFGYNCIYNPKAVSYHIGSATGVRNSKFYVINGRRNIEYIFFINMQGYLLYKYIISHIIYELFNFIYFTSIGKGYSFIKGKIQALLNFKYIINKRVTLRNLLKSKSKYNNLKNVESNFAKTSDVKDKFLKAIDYYKNFISSKRKE